MFVQREFPLQFCSQSLGRSLSFRCLITTVLQYTTYLEARSRAIVTGAPIMQSGIAPRAPSRYSKNQVSQVSQGVAKMNDLCDPESHCVQRGALEYNQRCCPLLWLAKHVLACVGDKSGTKLGYGHHLALHRSQLKYEPVILMSTFRESHFRPYLKHLLTPSRWFLPP